jgi:hypothetical protein
VLSAEGPRACSLRNALNSEGAISGWSLAGTQNRWNGSSTLERSELVPSSWELLLESPSVSPGLEPDVQ